VNLRGISGFLQRTEKYTATNPVGCSIKWEGKDKHWMPADARDLG
jgi:hypothetical protein